MIKGKASSKRKLTAAEPAAVESIEVYRRSRLRRFLAFFMIVVILPTILGAIYYASMASDFYVAESRFVIHSAETSSASALDTVLPSALGSFSARELYIVQAFLTSREALAKLRHDHDFLSAYQSPELDALSRLPSDVTDEGAFEYYQNLVEIVIDSQSGVGTLRLRAPTAIQAQSFSQSLLNYSEEMVNQLSTRAQEDRIRFALKEVDLAEDRVVAARVNLQRVQRNLEEFNPLDSASGVTSIRMQLEGELAKTRTELETQQSVLQPGAHQLVLLQNKINSLERQIGLEKQRLVDDTGGGLNVSAASFEAVAFEKEFAEERYATALRFLELSRVEALQQGRYLSVLSPPSLPDEPAYPRRYFGVLTVFAVAFAVFSVGGITLAVIREHARI